MHAADESARLRDECRVGSVTRRVRFMCRANKVPKSKQSAFFILNIHGNVTKTTHLDSSDSVSNDLRKEK